MNYQHIHDRIIERARTRASIAGYFEKHHVLPKSMGGRNCSSNLVVLTAREHYLVHWLLFKIYRSSSAAFGWHRMTHGRDSMRRYTSRTFEYARRARAAILSGANHPSTGKALSDAHRAKLRAAKLGRKYSEQGRESISPLKGKKRQPSKFKGCFGRSSTARAVVGTSSVTGEEVRFESIAAADRAGFMGPNVAACLAGRQKTCRGYRWRYAVAD